MYHLGLDSECLAELNVRGETLGRFNQWLDGKMLIRGLLSFNSPKKQKCITNA